MGAHKVNPTTQFFENRPSLDLSKCEDFKCSKCEATEFFTIFKLKKVSGIYSRSGREEIVPIEFFKCSSCGETTKLIKGQ